MEGVFIYALCKSMNMETNSHRRLVQLFFNDMVVNVTLAATSATAGTVPTFPAFIGAADQATTATSQVSGTNNATSGVYTRYIQEYVDIAGNVLTVGAAASNFVRYAEYPGQRLLKKVKFEVNGNPLTA